MLSNVRMHLYGGCVCLANVFLIVASALNIPTSSVALIGEKVEINCSVTGSGLTRWTYTSWNTSIERDIYLDEDIFDSLRSRYKIDKRINGHHNLIIESVDLAHAGRYECFSGLRKAMKTDIQLIVLGVRPTCASNVSETQHEETEHKYLYIYVWCSLSYTGNGDPVFSWSKSSEQQTIATNTTKSGSNKEALTSTSSIKEQLHSNDSGVVFQCRITFRVPDRNATNEFEYTWNCSLYGPRNLSIVEYEDRLECSAEGNPIPVYRWTDVDTNASTDGPVFMTNRIKKKEHILECTASNIFAAQNNNYTIKGHLTDSSMTQVVLVFPIAALAIGGSLLCLLVMAVIVLCVVHRKRQTGKTSQGNKQRGTGSARLPPIIPHQSRRLPSVPSVNIAPKTMFAKTHDTQITDSSESYCALRPRLVAAQQPELYCELRLNDQQSADYIKHSSMQQKSRNGDLV